MAVEDKNLPPDAGPHEGLINKLPFDVEKKTYPYWDGTIGRAVDMEYDGTETIEGSRPTGSRPPVTDEPIEMAEGVPGTYTNVVTVNVEPTTGAIVKAAQDQQRFLEDGTPVLDIQIVWHRRHHQGLGRRDQVQGQPAHPAADRASRSSASSAASLCLLGGVFLLMRQRPQGSGGQRGRPTATATRSRRS